MTSDTVDERFASIQDELLQRWPEDRIEPSLDRVRRAVELLGDPHRAYPAVHVAGTNGKTSTARLIDRLAIAAGLRTGRFTSPHLTSVRERIALVGEPIDVERFVETYDDIAPYLEIVDAESIGNGGPAMSTFEVLTVLALAAFAEAPVDAAVVEVGMGGTWDATNVVDGQVCVITPIGMDHQQYLGGTLELIAAEKAGIIPDDGLVVVAEQDPRALAVVLDQAQRRNATVLLEGRDFGVRARRTAVGGQLIDIDGLGGLYDELFLPLHGEHQARNAACALVGFECFLGGGTRRLDPLMVREGFAEAASPGRLEVVRRSPTVVIDAAHNPSGARATAAALEEAFGFGSLVAVVGVMDDKDARGILEPFDAVVDVVVATQGPDRRALAADALGAIAVDVMGDDRVEVVPRLVDALERAVELADERTAAGTGAPGVLVTGSVALAGQARLLMKADR